MLSWRKGQTPMDSPHFTSTGHVGGTEMLRSELLAQLLLCAAPWVVAVDSFLQLPETQELGGCECADSALCQTTHQQMQLEKLGSESLGTG